MNEAALRVCLCAHVSCGVSVCGCIPRGAAPLLSWLPPFSLPLHVFVPVFLHGGFWALVAGRSDATSALDPGLGSALGCFTSAVEPVQQTSIMWAQTVNIQNQHRRECCRCLNFFLFLFLLSLRVYCSQQFLALARVAELFSPRPPPLWGPLGWSFF